MNKRVGVIVLAAVLLMALLPYLRAGFLLDDYPHLERALRADGATLDYSVNSSLMGIQLWWLPGGVDVRFVRPLVSALVAVEARVFGVHAAPFHGVSLFLHLLNILLCYTIGRRIGLAAIVSALTAMAWGISIHAAGVVGWASGQSELLSAFFVLSSVACFLQSDARRSTGWLTAGAVSLVLALLCKESAVAVPLLLMAIWPRAGAPGRRRIVGTALALVGVYLVVRFFLDVPPPPPPYFEPVRSVLDVVRLPVKLLRYTAGAAFGVPVVPMVWNGGFSVAIVVVVGVAAWLALTRLARRRLPWELLWFISALIPYVFVMPTSLYLYTALCGLYWLIGRAVQEGRMVARGWLAGLVVVGLAGHVLAANFMYDVSTAIRDAGQTLVQKSVENDIVVVNAPFWMYAVPSAMRVANPASVVRIHVVDFAPAVRGGSETCDWQSGTTFEVKRPGGAFFQSPIETFFRFGAEPCSERASGDLINVSCAGDGLLRVRLERDAPVFVFDGWTLHEWSR